MVERSEYVWGSRDDGREFNRLSLVSRYYDDQTRGRVKELYRQEPSAWKWERAVAHLEVVS